MRSSVYIVQVYTTVIARSTSVFSFGFRKLKQYRTEKDTICRMAVASKVREMRKTGLLTRHQVKREGMDEYLGAGHLYHFQD